MKTKHFSLPVAHTAYEVTLSKKRPKVGKEEVQGYCHYEPRKIAAFDHPTPEVTRACVWHEFFHAVLHELGTDLSQNEALVEGLAIAVMRVRLEVPNL